MVGGLWPRKGSRRAPQPRRPYLLATLAGLLGAAVRRTAFQRRRRSSPHSNTHITQEGAFGEPGKRTKRPADPPSLLLPRRTLPPLPAPQPASAVGRRRSAAHETATATKRQCLLATVESSIQALISSAPDDVEETRAAVESFLPPREPSQQEATDVTPDSPALLSAEFHRRNAFSRARFKAYFAFPTLRAVEIFLDTVELIIPWSSVPLPECGLDDTEEDDPEQPAQSAASMSSLDALLMTLAILRQGLSLCVASDLAGVSVTTVGRYFEACVMWLDAFFEEFNICAQDCTEERAGAAAAADSDAFDPVVYVLDGTELPTDSPGDRLLQRGIFSAHKLKSMDALKWLVGLHPKGYINFVSDAFPGRITDNEITECGDLLDQCLKSGSDDMAEKGFIIADHLTSRGCYVWVPPHCRGGSQQSLDAYEVSLTRAMRHIRAFAILEQPVRLSRWRLFSNTFRVCAFLVNWVEAPARIAGARSRAAGGDGGGGRSDSRSTPVTGFTAVEGDDPQAAMKAVADAMAAP